MKKAILIIIVSFNFNIIFAQAKLPSFFSDHMVLQQNEEVSVWGADSPSVKIEVIASWGDRATTETNKDGDWSLKIKTPKAGGPYSLEIKGSDEIVLNDILTGEVWLCSGQSNMQMPIGGFYMDPVNGSNEAIIHSGNNRIRLFEAGRNLSIKPIKDVSGKWQLSGPSTVSNFSAVAYFYGKLLNEALDTPVGLIVTSWGGTKIEAWSDKETLLQFGNISIPEQMPQGKLVPGPSLVFNAMLYPFIPFNIKGVIWYQGESDHAKPEQYKTLFPAMIASWRKTWELGNFPFYFVQIASFNYNDVNSAYLREAQLYTMQNIENTGMAVTLDISNCGKIHPPEKRIVGERLAYWALSETYKIPGIIFSGPAYKSMTKSDDGKINLFFDHVAKGLSTFGKRPEGFMIAGDDRIFYPAQAATNKNKSITVWNEAVKNPIAVRYAFEDCASGNLFNSSGLPASSFRTDNWD